MITFSKIKTLTPIAGHSLAAARSETNIEWFVLSNTNLPDFFNTPGFFQLVNLKFGFCPTSLLF